VRWWVGVPVSVIGAIVTVIVCALVALMIQGRSAPTGDGEYVALGSSFGAGPGVTRQAKASPALCDRSENNYAHLVAQAKHLSLSDMTCSGAVTDSVLTGGQYFQGPQLRAVRSNTRLVTITVGGNDVFYLGNLFAWSCAQKPSAVPFAYKATGVCKTHSESQVKQAFAELPRKMTQIAADIRKIAPRAQIVFVDYTTVLPAKGRCAALPVTDAQANRARAVATKLQEITADVARNTDSTLVRASKATEGHDVCSADPWVYGFEWGSNPLEHSVLPYHPREAAMKQIAEVVEKSLR
jgi:lysophospholipase L1-like esterase